MSICFLLKSEFHIADGFLNNANNFFFGLSYPTFYHVAHMNRRLDFCEQSELLGAVKKGAEAAPAPQRHADADLMLGGENGKLIKDIENRHFIAEKETVPEKCGEED